MSDEILTYYNRELAYLRQMGAAFADKHPKIAGRLKMDQNNIEDPHVSRLLEGVAFLTAKIRHKLDDCFPELTDALLNTIYPDYQAPIPSTSIVQVQPKNNLEGAFELKRGMEIENNNPYDYNCNFKTCYDLNVWPYQIDSAKLHAAPFNAPEFEFTQRTKSVIKIDISCCPWVKSFAELQPDDFDCYLSGAGQTAFKLYESLFNNLIGISIVNPEDYSTAKSLDINMLKSKGFDTDESLLPYSDRSFSGNRLLAEYFVLPEKYLFFQLINLKSLWQGIGQKATVIFYLDHLDEELERQVSTQNFSYACTPIINLFEQRTDPYHLESYLHEVVVHPYLGEVERAEVQSILRVTLTSPDGEEIEVKPFYRTMHPRNTDEQPYYWHLRREMMDWSGAGALEGFETYISIVDANFKNQTLEQGWILNVDAQCTNRNQPAALPFGPQEPKMHLVESCSELLGIECQIPFSKSLRVKLHERTRWQLVSHLTLQHFYGDDGLDTLRRTLALYDFKGSPETANFIDGIMSLTTSMKSSRVSIDNIRTMVLGTKIVIEFRESQFSGNGIYLFAKVLESFFAQFSAINSFILLEVKVHGRLAPLFTGKPKAGFRALI